ncbi:GLPGLI family protein [Pedobacter aquatilis]|uniref:GLPGLI family protein n=1 Tax=Pedobacter aquatilis TaxID=351343 RepID=UPI00292F58C7|nr:GLPGLI family protein [Pedobacter aquatilis]
MKKICTTLSALAIGLVAFAQKPDKALSKVSYNFIHVQDTNQRDKPYTENMILMVGKNASAYTSFDKVEQAAIRRKKIEEAFKNQTESMTQGIKMDATGIKRTSNVDYFNFITEDKFYTKEKLVNNYVVEEPTPKLDWKISKDTMSISGISCQKATARFKGRNWIVWFAPELPFQTGPWKLNGLPGLIVEAYDDKKEVQFLFAGMDNINYTAEAAKTNNEKEPKIVTANGSVSVVNISNSDAADSQKLLNGEISLPKDAIKTSKKDLDKLKEAAKKDPFGFMNAQMAGRTSGIQVTGYGSKPTTTSSTPKIELNNPIELSDK